METVRKVVLIMDNIVTIKTIKTIITISQRCIPACDLMQVYELLQTAGISDEQIREYCNDYFIVNTCGYEEE